MTKKEGNNKKKQGQANVKRVFGFFARFSDFAVVSASSENCIVIA